MSAFVFDNRTPYAALHFDTLDQHGETFHVVVAKIAYALGDCDAHGVATLSALAQPVPLNETDRNANDDPAASVTEESDLAPFKPRCDVIVNATAYAPGGSALVAFPVRLTLQKPGQPALIDKSLSVCGRRWFERRHVAARLLSLPVAVCTLGLVRPDAWRLSAPEPLTRLPLRYEYAAGGASKISSEEDGAQRVPACHRLAVAHQAASCWIAHEVSQHNPLGFGFTRQWYLDATRCERIAAPQIAYAARPPTVPQFARCASGGEDPEAAGMGPVGRAWLPRRDLIGKIEEKTHWAPDEVPRLPAEFDEAYWNGAPADQQCAYPAGGERFTLTNLCSPASPIARVETSGANVLQFDLPRQAMFLLSTNSSQQLQIIMLDIDTITITPDAGRVDLVWRASMAETVGAGLAEVRLMHVREPAQLERLALLLRHQEINASPKSPAAHDVRQ